MTEWRFNTDIGVRGREREKLLKLMTESTESRRGRAQFRSGQIQSNKWETHNINTTWHYSASFDEIKAVGICLTAPRVLLLDATQLSDKINCAAMCNLSILLFVMVFIITSFTFAARNRIFWLHEKYINKWNLSTQSTTKQANRFMVLRKYRGKHKFRPVNV